MDTNVNQQPKIMKESKNKIKVDFERTPLKQRLKAKFLNLFFYQKAAWYLFRLVLLIGVSYVVISPFISMIAGSFMVPDDLVDPTVLLISRAPTLDIYKAVFTELPYWQSMWNTLALSLACALIQTFICCLIAYGLAKFRFRGNKIVFLLVILTLVIPHEVLIGSMVTLAQDVEQATPELGWMTDLYNSSWNGMLMILSATGLAFKNGLYVFMLRQFFSGVPDALEESAYIDGSGVWRTFFTIILPLSVPMLVTVFLFSFCWQWTDNFYTDSFYSDQHLRDNPFLPRMINSEMIRGTTIAVTDHPKWDQYSDLIKGTSALCVIAPLIVLYVFCQNFLVQGIERSGLTAD